MTLKVIDNSKVGERVKTNEGLEAVAVTGGEFREITIDEGEMFLLPGQSLPPHLGCASLKFPLHRQHASQPLPILRHCGNRH